MSRFIQSTDCLVSTLRLTLYNWWLFGGRGTQSKDIFYRLIPDQLTPTSHLIRGCLRFRILQASRQISTHIFILFAYLSSSTKYSICVKLFPTCWQSPGNLLQPSANLKKSLVGSRLQEVTSRVWLGHKDYNDLTCMKSAEMYLYIFLLEVS